MRQIWIRQFGSPEVLRVQDNPDPIPRSGEVRIRVQACGVTFADLLARMGQEPDAPPPPFVPGLEVTGIIDQVAQGVPDLKEGDAVIALTQQGGYSDVVCVPYYQVFPRLEWMSVEDGAALPVDYLLAYLSLVVMGAMRAGDEVLIHNAGGGVGLAALDICKILGSVAYGTASPDKHEFLQARGLQQAIDYRHYDYERAVMDLTHGRGVNLVLDSLGGVHWPKNYRLLRPAGRLVHIGMASMAPRAKKGRLSWWRGLIMLPFYTPLRLMRDNKGVMGLSLANLWAASRELQEWMAEIITWYDEALFRPHIDQVFSFAQAAEAHQYLHDRKNIGKVLLRP